MHINVFTGFGKLITWYIYLIYSKFKDPKIFEKPSKPCSVGIH